MKWNFKPYQKKITGGFCRSWIDFNHRIIFFRLLCLSVVVPLLALCASAVIILGKAPLWDSELFPESKPSEAEWYIFMFSNWLYFYGGTWVFPRKVLVISKLCEQPGQSACHWKVTQGELIEGNIGRIASRQPIQFGTIHNSWLPESQNRNQF